MHLITEPNVIVSLIKRVSNWGGKNKLVIFPNRKSNSLLCYDANQWHWRLSNMKQRFFVKNAFPYLKKKFIMMTKLLLKLILSTLGNQCCCFARQLAKSIIKSIVALQK